MHSLGRTLLAFALLHSVRPNLPVTPGVSQVAQMVKCLSAMQETWVRSLGWEDPLEKEMATHSSTLAWKIPGQRSLVGYSPWGHKESDMTERLHFSLHFQVFLDFLLLHSSPL